MPQKCPLRDFEYLDRLPRREIMGRVLSGEPRKTIAADFGISQRTVENHRAAIISLIDAG